MANMTKKHFVWLATEVAPYIRSQDVPNFTDTVARFASNSRFQRQTFIQRCYDEIQAKQHDESIAPEHYKLDDHIPALEENDGTNSAAA